MGRRSTRQAIVLSDEDRVRLERIARNPRSLRKHVWRARIVPALGAGCGPAGTMRRTGMSKPTVWRLVGPLPCPGRRRTSPGRHAPSGEEADPAHHNANDARPFRWSRKPEDLVEACKGGHRKLQEMVSDE